MKTQSYQWILYTIVSIITAMICIQFYWNYKNFLSAEQELIKDVQLSLDKAVDDYYAKLAQKTTMGFSLEGDNQKDIFAEDSQFSKIINSIEEDGKELTNIDSLEANKVKGVKVFKGRAVDSMMNDYKKKNRPISIDSFKKKIQQYKDENKETEAPNIELLTSKITVSIKNDTLDLVQLDSIFSKDIKGKNIDINYELNYIKKDNYDSIILKSNTGSLAELKENKTLKVNSNSPFLPKKSELNIQFTNPTLSILGRIVGGIVVSLLLIMAIISCLFYLLYVIKNQKELAEIKNDLISNITHEFKTPIATIGVALEGISNFNTLDDKEKTKKYINISTTHLDKLNTMVEKLLETATIDSENLDLKKEQIDLVELLTNLVTTYQMQFQENTFSLNSGVEVLNLNVDVFHFENAINNILDNAVKYGGNNIAIHLKTDSGTFQLSISDDGSNLKKVHQNRIFEKFYRVPKGNTHDVKGFGIGLHYTKSILEKHNGHIKVVLDDKLTTFKITMPNV